jgi:rhodanese-related sulfurtransferase
MLSFLLENWSLVAVALVSGGLLLWPTLVGGAGGGGVAPNEAVRLMNREKAVVIDVCESAEFEAGHITGARSIPLAKLDGAKELPTNKNLPLVVVCASGIRSRRAVSQLRKAGYEKANALAGGMKAWREVGLPVETGAR